MLNPVKMLNCVNTIIHNATTGYSVSLSNIPKNISKVAFPAIALIGGAYALAKADDDIYKDFEGCCSYIDCHDYEGCIACCFRNSLEYEELFYVLGNCARACVKHFY